MLLAACRQAVVLRLDAGLHPPLAETDILASGASEVWIEGRPGAIVIGGPRIPDPRWETPDDEIAARLPAGARAHVRVLEVPRNELARWKARNSSIAGPSHAGHGVDVRASPTEVFVGDRALTPARWPNEGWATIERIVDPGSVPRNAEPDIPVAQRSTEPARGGTFVPSDRSHLERWARAEDAWMHGYWNWDWSDELLPIAKSDPSAGTVSLAAPHRYGLAQRGRFYVTNVLEELDAPGECWIDRDRALVAAWLPADLPDAENAPVTLSLRSEPLITIPSGPDAPVCHVRGITFECTRGPAIAGTGVRGAEIAECVFRNIGSTAVSLTGTNVTVERCTFADVGGTGVSLRGGDRTTLTPSHDRVADCTFTRCGRLQRTYRPAIDIDGVGIEVLRNEISDLPHIAVIYAGNEHLIEANHVHHVVRETGDAGAVCVGRDWTAHGNVLRGNLVHDIPGTDARYQNAFYVDDMASGITLEDNLVIRCNWGMLIGGGRDNAIRRNAFVACGRAIMYDARGVGWMAPYIADPATSTLHRRLAEMPVDREPWRSRYPSLRTYLTDRFGRPVGGTVEGNALLATPLGTIEDRECVRESGTLTLPAPGAGDLTGVGDDLIARARRGRVQVGNAVLGPVGPAAPGTRR